MKCPGRPDWVSVYDNPQLIGGKEGKPWIRERTIYFVIRLLSSSECVKAKKCHRPSYTRCAVQYLKVNPAGKLKGPFFKFIPCSPGAVLPDMPPGVSGIPDPDDPN